MSAGRIRRATESTGDMVEDVVSTIALHQEGQCVDPWFLYGVSLCFLPLLKYMQEWFKRLRLIGLKCEYR